MSISSDDDDEDSNVSRRFSTIQGWLADRVRTSGRYTLQMPTLELQRASNNDRSSRKALSRRCFPAQAVEIVCQILRFHHHCHEILVHERDLLQHALLHVVTLYNVERCERSIYRTHIWMGEGVPYLGIAGTRNVLKVLSDASNPQCVSHEGTTNLLNHRCSGTRGVWWLVGQSVSPNDTKALETQSKRHTVPRWCGRGFHRQSICHTGLYEGLVVPHG